MFDLAEKELAISEVATITEVMKNHLLEDHSGKISSLIKAMANYIEKTSLPSSTSLLEEINQFLSEQDHYHALQRILIHIVAVGTAEEFFPAKTYTTGEAARLFGVSVATINNWLNQKRIIGCDKSARFTYARRRKRCPRMDSYDECH